LKRATPAKSDSYCMFLSRRTLWKTDRCGDYRRTHIVSMEGLFITDLSCNPKNCMMRAMDVLQILNHFRFTPTDPEKARRVLRRVVLAMFFSLGLLTGLFSISMSRFEGIDVSDLVIGPIGEGWPNTLFLFSVFFSLSSVVLSVLVRRYLMS